MQIEIPLVIFTLFDGLAIGATAWAVAAEWLDWTGQTEPHRELAQWGAYLALVCLAIGLLASPFHLGRPLAMLNGLSNLGSSWIAREALFGLVYLALGAVYAGAWLLRRRVSLARGWRFVLANLAGLAALAMIISQAMIYTVVRTIPTWNNSLTLLFFGVSAALLGTLLVGSGLVVLEALTKSPADKTRLAALLPPVVRVGIWAVIGAILVGALQLVNIGATPSAAASSALRLLTGPLIGLVSLRFVVGMLVPLVLLGAAWVQARREPQRIGTWLIASFGCVLVGELAARALFFLSALHI